MPNQGNKMVRQALICVACSACVLAFGCRPEVKTKPRFGPEDNARRVRDSLPPMPDDWQHVRDGPSSAGSVVEIWQSPGSPDRPCHWQKQMWHRNGELMAETDVYHSGRVVASPDPDDKEKIHEEVRIILRYYEPSESRTRWYAMASGGDAVFSVEQAEARLRSWGIHR